MKSEVIIELEKAEKDYHRNSVKELQEIAKESSPKIRKWIEAQIEVLKKCKKIVDDNANSHK